MTILEVSTNHTHALSEIKLKQSFSGKYFECVGEALPLARNEKKMIEYLKSIHCLNAFYNERDELIWYIRGKNLKEKTRGEICRSRPMKKSPSNRFCGKNQTNKRMSGAGSASR